MACSGGLGIGWWVLGVEKGSHGQDKRCPTLARVVGFSVALGGFDLAEPERQLFKGVFLRLSSGNKKRHKGKKLARICLRTLEKIKNKPQKALR